jgi:Concanavalin A-like lectin/glucanases superfamily
MPREARCWTVGTLVTLACLACAAAAPASPPGLLGRYDLDGLVGASTPDSSGNGLNAVRVGAPAAVADGRFGGAFRFGGSMDGFLGEFPPLRPATVTVAAWVRAAATPGPYRYVVSQGASGCAYTSYALYTGDAPGLRFFVWNGAAVMFSPPSPGDLWDGGWHLVTGTYDGVAVRLYVDARQVGAGTLATGSIAYGLPNNTFAIGNNAGSLGTPVACPGDYAFRGDIDEVQVFDRALSAVEIASLMTHESSGGGSAPPGDTGPPPPPPPTRVLRVVPVTVSWDHKVRGRSTRFTRLEVKGVPRGSTVRVTCAKGCSRKSYVKRNARGTVSIRRFARKPLRAGTRIRVVVTHRGMIGAVKTLTVRAGRDPSVTTRCLPPGAKRGSAC